MGFDGVVEVNETDKLNTAVSGVFKTEFVVPHVHQGTDHPISFSVGLRTIDARKLLANTVLRACFDERVTGSPLKFLAVIGLGIIDLISNVNHICLCMFTYRCFHNVGNNASNSCIFPSMFC